MRCADVSCEQDWYKNFRQSLAASSLKSACCLCQDRQWWSGQSVVLMLWTWTSSRRFHAFFAFQRLELLLRFVNKGCIFLSYLFCHRRDISYHLASASFSKICLFSTVSYLRLLLLEYSLPAGSVALSPCHTGSRQCFSFLSPLSLAPSYLLFFFTSFQFFNVSDAAFTEPLFYLQHSSVAHLSCECALNLVTSSLKCLLAFSYRIAHMPATSFFLPHSVLPFWGC